MEIFEHKMTLTIVLSSQILLRKFSSSICITALWKLGSNGCPAARRPPHRRLLILSGTAYIFFDFPHKSCIFFVFAIETVSKLSITGPIPRHCVQLRGSPVRVLLYIQDNVQLPTVHCIRVSRGIISSTSMTSVPLSVLLRA